MQFNLKLATVAAACVLATAAQAQVTFDANYENDTSSIGSQTKGGPTTLTNAGRVELNVGATAKNGANFITGKATPLLKQDGTYAIDDAWLQLGNATADVKLGRFEAADLFPLGKDVVVEKAAASATAGYAANTLRGRTVSGSSSTNPLHAAVGVNAGAARLELGLFAATNAAATTEVFGLRPTVVYSAGDLTFRAGLESIKTTNAADQTGYGVSVGYALNSTSALNLNFARNNDLNLSSIGLNATLGGLGLGFVQDKNVNDSVNTIYAAYSMPLLGIKGATVTPALSNSTTSVAANASVTALRLRFNYGF